MKLVHPHTEAIDKAIIDGYRATRSPGFVDQIARAVRRPRHYILKRAVSLGVTRPKSNNATWTEAEDALLEKYAALTPENASRRMRQAGFSRSASAIAARRKIHGLTRAECRADAGIYTANQLAGFMGTNSNRVIGWINKGWLKAKPMGTARPPERPDFWAIKAHDVRRFILDNTAQVEIHLCDKFWLVDLLSRGQGGSGTDKN